MMKIFFNLFIITIIIGACNNISNYKDFNEDLEKKVNYEINKDSLHLHFRVGFKNDKVCIYVNKKKISCSTITTNDAIGLAKIICIDRKELKNLTISINNMNNEIRLNPTSDSILIVVTHIGDNKIQYFYSKEHFYYN